MCFLSESHFPGASHHHLSPGLLPSPLNWCITCCKPAVTDRHTMHVPYVILKLNILFWDAIDLQFHVPLAQFPPVVISCKTIVSYYNQDIYIHHHPPTLFRFPQFSLHFCAHKRVSVRCMHLVLGNFLRVGLSPYTVKIQNSSITAKIRHVTLFYFTGEIF